MRRAGAAERHIPGNTAAMRPAVALAQAPLSLQQEPVRTPVTARPVYAALKKAWDANALAMGGRASPPALSLLLAYWAMQTEHGTRCWNWNLAGIRCLHPTVQYHVYVPAAAPVVPDGNATIGAGQASALRGACLRHFFSLEGGAEGYLATLRASCGSALAHARSGDATGFAHALGRLTGGTDSLFVATPAAGNEAEAFNGYVRALEALCAAYRKTRPGGFQPGY